jgi:hypothetical protein
MCTGLPVIKSPEGFKFLPAAIQHCASIYKHLKIPQRPSWYLFARRENSLKVTGPIWVTQYGKQSSDLRYSNGVLLCMLARNTEAVQYAK